MVRYFSYIDVSTIESCYNQLENSYISKKVNNTRSNELEGKVTLSLPNIIRGFFTGEGALRATGTVVSSEDFELAVSIEKKIQKLLDSLSTNEMEQIDIRNFEGDRKLVCGTIQVMEQRMFLDVVSMYYNKKFDTYEDFLFEFDKNKEVVNKWGKMRQQPNHMNGVAIFDILNSWSFNINKIMTFIIVDYEKPICMELSSQKITKPHSDMRSSALFASTTKYHILGITNNMGGMFTIKPLALWDIISGDDCDALVSL